MPVVLLLVSLAAAADAPEPKRRLFPSGNPGPRLFTTASAEARMKHVKRSRSDALPRSTLRLIRTYTGRGKGAPRTQRCSLHAADPRHLAAPMIVAIHVLPGTAARPVALRISPTASREARQHREAQPQDLRRTCGRLGIRSAETRPDPPRLQIEAPARRERQARDQARCRTAHDQPPIGRQRSD